MNIVMIEEKYTKKEGTKTVWVLESSRTANINEAQYYNIQGSTPFFRRLGGSETWTCGYTSRGYLGVKLVSTSPDKQDRTVRKFKFD